MDEQSLDFFVELERRVWTALTLGDAAADEALLTPGFLGVYPTGFATRADHVGQLAGGATVDSYSIHQARLVRVSSTAVLLCYRAEFRRLRGGVAGPIEAMYVGSLWIERDGEWRNSFSQDTPV
ncbi:MAG: nuclear transport factor 2 family protein [Actinomycetia bacterium]|nr:nuclear transport factor 2 family protein [Actinomycetes bacterium]